jgi:hypothetical protein
MNQTKTPNLTEKARAWRAAHPLAPQTKAQAVTVPPAPAFPGKNLPEKARAYYAAHPR